MLYFQVDYNNIPNSVLFLKEYNDILSLEEEFLQRYNINDYDLKRLKLFLHRDINYKNCVVSYILFEEDCSNLQYYKIILLFKYKRKDTDIISFKFEDKCVFIVRNVLI
jgi:hypothetical protein